MNLELLGVVAALVVTGLLASRLGFGARGLPTGVQLLLSTGTPYIFVGVLVGPQGLGVVTPNFLHELGPIVIIGFGWIGFLYGTHFEWRRLRRFKPRMYLAGFSESLLTLGGVSFVAWLLLPIVEPGMQPVLRMAASFGLGICAAGTAPAGVFMLARRGGVSRADIDLLKFFSAIDDLPAILGLGILFAVLAPELVSGFGGIRAIVIGVVLGGVLGLVAHLLMPMTRKWRRHAFVIILGMAALCAGAAELMGLSPLFVSVVGGMVFTNLSPRKEDIYGLMVKRESTLYAVFLIVAGALLRFEATRVVLVVAPLYVLLRAASKIVGARLGALVADKASTHPLLGVGLLFQGGLGLVVAVQLDYSAVVTVSRLFMTTVVFAVVINDVLGAPLAHRLLDKARP